MTIERIPDQGPTAESLARDYNTTIEEIEQRRTRTSGGGVRKPPTPQADGGGTFTVDQTYNNKVVGYTWDVNRGQWLEWRMSDIPASIPTGGEWSYVKARSKISSRTQPTSYPTDEQLADVYGGTVDYGDVGDSSGGGGGGGRSGGGSRVAAAPEVPRYVAPNSDALESQVKSYVVATTGMANEHIVRSALNAYLSADREAFDRQISDSLQEEPNPWGAVLNTVRDSAEYKAIHQLRPESVDEMDWVTTRQAKLRSLGLSAQRAESLGARQAQSGANDAALVDAAEMANVADTGRLFQSQRDSLAASARSVMGLI